MGRDRGEELLQNPTFTGGQPPWRANQRVDISAGAGLCAVIKAQRSSTPGIFQRVSLIPGAAYQLLALGRSDTHAFLWADDDQGRRLSDQRVLLPRRDEDAPRSLSFTAPPGGVARVGILFSSSAPLGGRLLLRRLSLRCVGDAEEAPSRPAAAAEDRPVPAREGPEEVARWDAPPASVCRLVARFSAAPRARAWLVGVDVATGAELIRRQLEPRHGHLRRTFLTDGGGPVAFTVEIRGDRPRFRLLSLELERLQSRHQPMQLGLGDRSITAAIATYPGRADLLPDAVESLVEQVDHLFIYLNNYQEVPAALREHPAADRIHPVVDPSSMRRASAKFHWAWVVPGYHLVCDDDILYPPDYAERLVARIDAFERRAIVGVHGAIYRRDATDPVAHRQQVFNFQRALPRDTAVHLVGTGTAAWHGDLMKGVDLGPILRHPIANDEALAVIAKAQGIPMVCVARGDGWLRSNPGMKFGIWEEKQLIPGAREPVNALVAGAGPWPAPQLPAAHQVP